MRSLRLTFVAVGVLSVLGWGCGGSSPSPDASDAPKDAPKDTTTGDATGGGGSGGDGGVDKADVAADVADGAADKADVVVSDVPKDAVDGGGGDADGGGTPACMVATDCPGMDSECQHRTCTAGVCGVANDAAGKILATQIIGDCKVRQCSGTGTVATANDNTDIPDDINACTKDACAAGVASHTPVAANTSCGGGKLCNATGQCMGCNSASDCPGTDNFCRTRTCINSICGVTFTAAGTKLVDAQSGDCKIQQCDGMGVIQTVANAADIPADNNPCTLDQCNGTTPTHQPVARNTVCGTGQVCDGASHCVTCLSASTCPGTDTECQKRTCVNGGCGISFTPSGTAVMSQIAGDCKKNQCDGHGAVVSVMDNTDPLVDNNPCTNDLCTNGVPSNQPVVARTNCGANLQCDGVGHCVQCLGVGDCPGTDTDCQKRTCTNGTCGVSFTAAGTPTTSQTLGDCKKNQCDGNGAMVTVNDDSDPQNDNNPCTSDICTAGVNSHPNVALHTTCGTGLECDGNGKCVGCVQASECGTNSDCMTHTCTNSTCVHTPMPRGAPVSMSTQIAGDCQKKECDGSGNVEQVPDNTDLPVDGLACTSDLCMNGSPSNPPVASGTACMMNNGMKCNATGSCVQCLTAADCGVNTECQTFTCTNGMCATIKVMVNTPITNQTVGDCQKVVCDGNGGTMSIADNTDIPNDNNPCTDDLCTNGVKSNPVVVDRVCQGNRFCKSDGTCVACNHDAQCGTDTECKKNTCVNDVCSIASSPPLGTPLAMQVTGDCKTAVCDGNGGTTTQPNTTDVHNDGNDCTKDLCNGETPDNSQPEMVGTMCLQGAGMCDGMGNCAGCLNDGQCGTNTDCLKFTCNKAVNNGTCEQHPIAVNTAVSMQTTGDCKLVVCDGNGSTKTNVDQTDLPDDGNPCTDEACDMSGTPSHPPKPLGTMCTQMGTNDIVCDGMGTCVNCNTAADCGTNSADGCKVYTCNSNICGRADPPAGTLATVGQTPKDCNDLVCDGSGGTKLQPNVMDLPIDGNDCTIDACDGNGTPSNPLAAAGFACNQNGGRRCNGAGTCIPAFAVLRAGDGTTNVTSMGVSAAVFIETRTEADGTLLGTPLPLSSGQANAYSISGSASSEGALSLSRDEHYLTTAGYNNAPGTASVNSIAGVRRMAVRVDSSSNIDTTSGLLPVSSNMTILYSINNVRSAVTETGLNYWYGGAGTPSSSGGVWSNDKGTIVQEINSSNNLRWCLIYSTANSTATSQLYCSGAGSGFSSVVKIGTGLPEALTTTTNLTGLPTSASSPSPNPFAFAFMDLNAGDSINPDTLYISDDHNPNGGTTTVMGGDGGVVTQNCTGGGVQKWTSDANGTWSCQGTFQTGTTGVRGLAALKVSGKVSLITTNAANPPNAIVKCVDDLVTVPSMATCSTIVTAPNNMEAYKGVAVVPIP